MNALNENELTAMAGYYRAVNYISAASLYLKDNPLLKRPLSFGDIKENSSDCFMMNAESENQVFK